MLNARYIFDLNGECRVETEGSPTEARSVSGSKFTRGDYFDDDYQDTYIIQGQNGQFVVLQEDVNAIIDIQADDDGLTELDIYGEVA